MSHLNWSARDERANSTESFVSVGVGRARRQHGVIRLVGAGQARRQHGVTSVSVGRARRQHGEFYKVRKTQIGVTDQSIHWMQSITK